MTDDPTYSLTLDSRGNFIRAAGYWPGPEELAADENDEHESDEYLADPDGFASWVRAAARSARDGGEDLTDRP